MDEAMRCDRVALIQKGLILTVAPPQKIRESFSRKLFMIKAHEKYKLIIALRKYPDTVTAYPFGDSVHVTFADDRIDDSLFRYLGQEGLTDVSAEETMAGIEDRFLELM
jgi:ABC-type multidrug transport system ATPase subunit